MTNDVDAVIGAEHTAVQRAVHEIGRQHGWGESWLNEGVSVYLSQNNDVSLFKSYPSTGGVGLRVYLASPRYMLAMKLASLRTGVGQRDVDDVTRLAHEIGVSTVDELLAIHKAYFPNHPLDARRIVMVGEIAEQLNASPPS
jgi:hypothetical protein